MMITQAQIRALIDDRTRTKIRPFSYTNGVAFKWETAGRSTVYLVEYFLEEHVGIWSHDLANATVVEERSLGANDILSILRKRRRGKFGIVDMTGKQFRVPLVE